MKNADFPAMPIFNDNGFAGVARHVLANNEAMTTGLTKFEYAVIEAMKGLVSNPNIVTEIRSANPEEIGQYAYNLAIGTFSMLDALKGVNNGE